MKLPKDLNAKRTNHMIPDLRKELRQNIYPQLPAKRPRHYSSSNFRVLWTSNEVQALILIVESKSSRKWKQIAADLNNQVHSSLSVRNAKSCRNRWIKQTMLQTQEFQSTKMEEIKSKKANLRNSTLSENLCKIKKQTSLETNNKNSSLANRSRSLCINDRVSKSFDEGYSMQSVENHNIKNKSSRTEVNQADEHLRIFEDGEKNSNLGKVHMQQLINTKIYLEFEVEKNKFQGFCTDKRVIFPLCNFESEKNLNYQQDLHQSSIPKNDSISDENLADIEQNLEDSNLNEKLNFSLVDENQDHVHSLEYDPDIHMNSGIELSKCSNNFDLNLEYLGENNTNNENTSQLWSNNPVFQSWFPFDDNIEVDLSNSYEFYSKDWLSTTIGDSDTED